MTARRQFLKAGAALAALAPGIAEADTRPQLWQGRAVPEVLVSGNHAQIRQWRRAQAERLTRERRPDLWRRYLAQAAVESRQEGER